MSFSLIERKIQKYTHKLSRSTTRDRANLYQQKLRYYHNLNQSGGGVKEILAAVEEIGNIKETIKTKFKKNKEKLEVLEDTIKKKEEEVTSLKKAIDEKKCPVSVVDETQLENLNKELEDLKGVLKKVQQTNEDLVIDKEDFLNEITILSNDKRELGEQIKSSDEVLDEILGFVGLIAKDLKQLEGGCGGACGLPLLPMYGGDGELSDEIQELKKDIQKRKEEVQELKKAETERKDKISKLSKILSSRERRDLQWELEDIQHTLKIKITRVETLEKEQKRLERKESLTPEEKVKKKEELKKLEQEAKDLIGPGRWGLLPKKLEELKKVEEEIKKLRYDLGKLEQEGGCGGACGLPFLPMYSEY